MLKVSFRLVLPAMLTAALCGTVAAHHGTSVNYDQSRTMTLTGTVTEFHWRNPHSTLFVDVTEDSGEVTHYAIELPSPTLLSRGDLGWTRRTFQPGDHVELSVHPSRTGAAVALGCMRSCPEVLINGEPPVNAQ